MGQHRLLPAFYADRAWAHITDWRSELAPYYDRAERMLGVVTYPGNTPRRRRHAPGRRPDECGRHLSQGAGGRVFYDRPEGRGMLAAYRRRNRDRDSRQPGRLLTVENYASLGEDERGRYELQEGSLVVSPSPHLSRRSQ